VRYAVERQEVVHAQRVKRDRPGDDQLVVAVLVGKRGRPKRLRRQKLSVCIGHPARRVPKILSIGVSPQCQQELARCPLDSGVVDLAFDGEAFAR
jgi:hypothetical protein